MLSILLLAAWLSVSASAQYEFIFGFGDSYSTNGYSGESPLKPYKCNVETGDGPNYLQHSATVQGSRLIDLAHGGATIDNSIIGYGPTQPLDLVGQVAGFDTYLRSSQVISWTGENSLFAFMFGINDINVSYNTANVSRYNAVVASYVSSIETIYMAGARHVVVFNVPPFDQSPQGIALAEADRAKLTTAIETFNDVLQDKVSTFCDSTADLECNLFDTHGFLSTVINNYKDFGFLLPDTYCQAYADGRSCEANATTDTSCDGPRSAYIWANALHISSQTHKLLAEAAFGKIKASPMSNLLTSAVSNYDMMAFIIVSIGMLVFKFL